MLPLFVLAIVPEIKASGIASALLVIMTFSLLFGWAMKPITIAALGFMFNPDMRATSRHKYPNGNGMSVFDAKQQGLSE